METFEDYRRRRIDEAEENLPPPGEAQTQAGTIQQVPEPAAESPSMLVGALQGAGLGLVASYLGFKGLQMAKKALARAGYGYGSKAFIRYARSILPKKLGGQQPYTADTYKFTPEEQQQLARRLSQIVGQERAAMNAPEEGGVEDNNPMLRERLQDFVGKVFDPAKTPRRAVAALERATAAFSKGAEPVPQDMQTVVAALSSGSASAQFKEWFKKTATKPNEINKTVGRGKAKQTLQYTHYDLGKLPMTKVDFGLIVKYYRSIYGYPTGTGKSSLDDTKPTAPVAPEADIERAARDHRMSRTADALRRNREVPPPAGV